MSDRIVLVELQKDYGPVIDHHLALADGATFFVPSVQHAAAFVACATARGVDLADRMLAFQTIDPGNDAFLYTTTRELAKALIDIIRSCSLAVAGARDHLIPQIALRGLTVGLSDRFVTQGRGLVVLAGHVARDQGVQVDVIPRAFASMAPLAHFLRTLGIEGARFLTGHLPRAARMQGDVPEGWDLPLPPKRFHVLPSFDRAAVLRAVPRRSVVLVTNFRDRQYGLTALPLLRGLRRGGALVAAFAIYSSPDLSWLDSFEELREIDFLFKEAPARPAVLPLEAISPHAAEILRGALRRFHIHCERHREPMVRALSVALSGYAARALAPLLYNVQDLAAMAEEVARRCDALVVSPGRHLEASILTGAARARGVPSIEVQSGTLSATPRFVAPNATDILCIEPFSRRVYVDFLGHDPARVHVVGSPKIDLGLAPARRLDRESAFRRLARDGVDPARPLLTLATQPVGRAAMEAVTRLVIQAMAAWPDAQLLIKQHPNEDESYESAYRRVAGEQGFTRLIVSRTADVHCSIVAADLVLTYFSTVGLEAFALGRPVVCVNPFADRPPFDLVALGVAREATCALDLAGWLRDPPAALDATLPELAVLQDGRATERCVAHILARADERRAASAWWRLDSLRRLCLPFRHQPLRRAA